MGMLQGMDNVQFHGRGRGATTKTMDITCECTRPNTNVHCNVCGYSTVGRIRKLCPRHPTVSVFTTGLLFFRCVLRVAKGDYYLCHVCLSFRPRGTTWLPLDRFSWSFIFEYFYKIFRKSQVLLLIYDKNNLHSTWRYIYIYIYIQGVPGGSDKTSGECSLC